jgi:Notch-like protein
VEVGNIFRNTGRHYPKVEFRYISTQEIDKIIKSLKAKGCHGYDEISVKILKWGSPFIVSPLTYIFNKSLEMGTFPSRLKFSIVKPIYKAGDKQNIATFRPISLLISFYKVFEKIIYSRMYNHMVQNSILLYSTDRASYILTHEILTALNNKQIVLGNFCI